MKAVMLAHDALAAGTGSLLVAGGMESMTNAPYLLPKMRGGARLGHAEAKDHMFLDGLEDAYDRGRLMGSFAEDCATEFQFTRAAQDAYALASLTGRPQAQASGAFGAEIAPVDRRTARARRQVTRTSSRARPAREDPDAEACLPQGRHGDGRELLLDLRRRGGAGPDARGRGAGARAAGPGAGARARQPCAGAGALHDRPGPAAIGS